MFAWKLRSVVRSPDVTEALALQASGCDQADVIRKPCSLSDNGSTCISSNLADWLIDNCLRHVRGERSLKMCPTTRMILYFLMAMGFLNH